MILASGCSQSGFNDDTIVKTTELYTEDKNIRICDMFLKDGLVYLLGGEAKPIWEGDQLHSEEEAFVFHTDDKGKKWAAVSLGEGMLEKIFYKGKNWYALKCSKISESPSSLYVYEENSREWQLYREFPFWVYDIAVLDERNMLVLGKEKVSMDMIVYRTTNKEEQIEKIALRGNAVLPLLDGHTLFYLTALDTSVMATRNALVEYNINTREESITSFPDDFDAYLFRKYKDSILLFGKKGKQLCLYKRSSDRKYYLLYVLESGEHIFPKGLYTSGNQLLLWMGVREDGYTTNKMIISEDAGMHWQEKQLLAPAYAGPVFVEQQDQGGGTWVYMGRNGIQMLSN